MLMASRGLMARSSLKQPAERAKGGDVAMSQESDKSGVKTEGFQRTSCPMWLWFRKKWDTDEGRTSRRRRRDEISQ